MTPKFSSKLYVFLSLASLSALAAPERLSDSGHLGKNYRRVFEKNESCKDLENFMMRNQQAARLSGKKFTKEQMMKTDQFLVYRKGKVYYETYDGYFKKDTPHCLWSASKSITATLIGAAQKTQDLNLSDRLSTYFSASKYRLSLQSQEHESNYKKITLQDLISMSASFNWHESYDDDPISSTFMPMLYGSGRSNMLAYALSQPMSAFKPGTRWIYSGGNSLILMGVLKKIAQQKDSSLNKYISTLLFEPLDMQQAFFETDVKGIPVGNSYAYLNPQEMLNIGILYLQNGNFNGRQILSPEFIQASLQQSDGITHTDIVSRFGLAEFEKLKKVVIQEGAYGQTGFWLNQSVKNIMENEFKNSPKDMYFAAGHYGQLIMVIPSEQTVIVRTGHDADYWSRIDSIVSKTLRCTRDLEKSL